jgi:ribosomal protein S27E
MDEKIKTLEKRVEKLETEIKNGANRIHCRQCGSIDVELELINEMPLCNNEDIKCNIYKVKCKHCEFTDIRHISHSDLH